MPQTDAAAIIAALLAGIAVPAGMLLSPLNWLLWNINLSRQSANGGKRHRTPYCVNLKVKILRITDLKIRIESTDSTARHVAAAKRYSGYFIRAQLLLSKCLYMTWFEFINRRLLDFDGRSLPTSGPTLSPKKLFIITVS